MRALSGIATFRHGRIQAAVRHSTVFRFKYGAGFCEAVNNDIDYVAETTDRQPLFLWQRRRVKRDANSRVGVAQIVISAVTT